MLAGRSKKRRSNQIVPTVRPPKADFVKRLNEEEKHVLDRYTTEPVECIYQDKFRLVRTARQLFGESEGTVSNSEPLNSSTVLPEPPKNRPEAPTLSAKQERFLFEQYNYARYRVCQVLKKYSKRRLPYKAARELIHWGRLALQTRGKIIQLNMPLILSMTKRSRLAGLDFNELVSEGSLALIRSTEKFDVTRGFKFSTYACRAILKSFSRVAMKVSRYRGLFPVELNIELERSDFIEHKRVTVAEDCLDELKHILTANLAHLNDVERTVIHERFSIGSMNFDGRIKTLEQVGELIGVTKERVRQIQNKALQKIKIAMEEQILAA